MIQFWRDCFLRQFGAAIEMIENAIRVCPDELWSEPSSKPAWASHGVVGFWYLVYHILFFLDLQFSDPAEEFAPPPPFTLDELDLAGLLPERPYTKAELQKYLSHSREKCLATLTSLTEEQARLPRKWGRFDLTFGELLMYGLRHVQHHAGQLNLLLRQNTGSAPRWVGYATVPAPE